MEGHVHALDALGGVPLGQVRYDSLKAAVVKVLDFSRARVENEQRVLGGHADHQGPDRLADRPASGPPRCGGGVRAPGELAADRDRIVGNIKRAFESCGYELQVQEPFDWGSVAVRPPNDPHE